LARKADYSKFQELNVQILGISYNNEFSQKTHAASLGLPYPLLSDIYLKAIRAYGAGYGSTGAKVEYPGLEGRQGGRMFFLVDKEGMIRGKWIGEDMAVFPSEPILKAAGELSGM
jgi:peroxiredoxin